MPPPVPKRGRVSAPDTTSVLIGVSWVFLSMGLLSGVLFLLHRDLGEPQLLLVSVTSLVGTGSLRLLARLLR
jgi:hypothetical protein